MARLALALLGSLLVTLDESPVTGLAYDKVRALLAYVSMETEQPLSRDVLAALLWPDQPSESSRGNLRKALATLRQALGDQAAQTPFLLSTRDTIQFNHA